MPVMPFCERSSSLRFERWGWRIWGGIEEREFCERNRVFREGGSGGRMWPTDAAKGGGGVVVVSDADASHLNKRFLLTCYCLGHGL